jgi:hypothetical protein
MFAIRSLKPVWGARFRQALHVGMSLVLGLPLLLAAAGPAPAGPLLELPASAADAPVPIGRGCAGVNPTEPPPVCCLYGYVYYNGWPVEDASVVVQSATGSITTTTDSGPISSYPYYDADLSAAPLSVAPGSTITVTATYSNVTASKVYVVVSGGQQVDVATVDTRGSLPPIATIHTITPSPATPADTITFYGSGQDQDEDGQSIAGYLWQVDGITRSTAASFTLSAVAVGVGTHTVSFQVQDNEGTWSTAITETLTIDATACKIAYQSSRDGNYEIYTMNCDGTEQTRLTNNTAPDNGPA